MNFKISKKIFAYPLYQILKLKNLNQKIFKTENEKIKFENLNLKNIKKF
jgi:hypothetical protein